MTYCLAIRLDEGLVFCSDSRTNAGADRVSTYSKMHRFSLEGDRSLVILTAGNLATTQAVIAQIQRDIEDDAAFNIMKARYVSDIAQYIGQLSLAEQKRFAGESGEGAGFNASASFIVGGQIKDYETELYMVYPEGNYITTSDRYPYLQIGETKYGKPILDRIIRPDTDFETALHCALVSLEATVRSNATVGPPLECLLYTKDSLKPHSFYRSFDEHSPYLIELRNAWNNALREAFADLPKVLETPESEF